MSKFGALLANFGANDEGLPKWPPPAHSSDKLLPDFMITADCFLFLICFRRHWDTLRRLHCRAF